MKNFVKNTLNPLKKLVHTKKYLFLTLLVLLSGSVLFLLSTNNYSLKTFIANASSENGETSTNSAVKYSGYVEVNEVSINSKIAGRILKLNVEEGQAVKAGDVIVEISSDELQAKKAQLLAQIAQAEAACTAAKEQTKAAQAQLNKAENGARKQEIEQAKLAYELGEKSLTRVNELYTNKKEQTLALIDAASAAYEAAKAQTLAAKAVDEKATNGARTQEIAQAQTQYDLASKTYERVKTLYSKGAVSAQKLDEVNAQLNVISQTLSMAKEGARIEDKSAAHETYLTAVANEEARKSQLLQANSGLGEVDSTFGLKKDEASANVEIRKQAYNMALEGARTEDKSAAIALVAQAQAGEVAATGKLDQAKAGLEEVEAYLKDTKVVSPISGTITALNSNEGELVSTGMSIATVSSVQKPWISVKVKETDLEKINIGQNAQITLPGFSNKVFTGKILSINKKADFATKRATNDNGDIDILSFGVKISIDKNESQFKPGMTASIIFLGK